MEQYQRILAQWKPLRNQGYLSSSVFCMGAECRSCFALAMSSVLPGRRAGFSVSPIVPLLWPSRSKPASSPRFSACVSAFNPNPLWFASRHNRSFPFLTVRTPIHSHGWTGSGSAVFVVGDLRRPQTPAPGLTPAQTRARGQALMDSNSARAGLFRFARLSDWRKGKRLAGQQNSCCRSMRSGTVAKQQRRQPSPVGPEALPGTPATFSASSSLRARPFALSPVDWMHGRAEKEPSGR